MAEKIVTRFAPSPTGFLHIGGARTALFNWLYARGRGGKMLLRIEDTDRERSSAAAVEAIKEGLRWLGLDWDGEPFSQFAHADRHREIAMKLLAAGHAYRCYCSAEELEEMRERARAEKRPPRYDGRWRDRDAAEAPAGIAPVIRFRSPETGETVIEDRVQGRVVISNRDLDDMIILRSDGSPTYNLSVVVDDHDMGITHIIRGVDHLTNAARQKLVYEALGWTVPVMAHIPLIHGADGTKLSKRHGALGVAAYREMGYLPAAMRNYLARLGWSHGDDEIFTTEQMLEWFDLDGIGKSPARFDFVKLANLNGHYMRAMTDEALFEEFLAALRHLPGGDDVAKRLTPELKQQIRRALPGLKERAKTLVELLDGIGFLIAARPIEPDEKASKILGEEARGLLGELLPRLTACAEWHKDALESTVREFCRERGVKLGKVAQPLRAALTGRSTSPGIFDVLEVLGRKESLARIADQAGGS